jgi:excisionase family DNA binding protein
VSRERKSALELTATRRLVTVQDAALYLSVSVSTLYGWVYQRRIPFIKVGRALRFDLADLEHIVEVSRIRPKGCYNACAAGKGIESEP